MPDGRSSLDVLIFGGGIAGLWLLDELRRRSFRALLIERNALGAGQTVASQGILHGGLKYMLGGVVSGSAASISDLPPWWRSCLAGERPPDLRGVRVVSRGCHLWRTESLASWAAMSAARLVLHTPLRKVSRDERPEVLRRCPGDVYMIDEQVVEPASLLEALLGLNRDAVLRVDADGVEFRSSSPGVVDAVTLTRPGSGAPLVVQPATVVFAAGEGNAELRRKIGLSADVMQRRPLHMVLARGPLPALFGHCIDGNRTRATITTAVDSAGRNVWQIGGEIAEQGVRLDSAALIARAKTEVEEIIPGLDLAQADWATYRIDRAEGLSADGRRPDGPVVRREGNTVTVWPTKLVLAPRLATMIADQLNEPGGAGSGVMVGVDDWPRPSVAAPPWEEIAEWSR